MLLLRLPKRRSEASSVHDRVAIIGGGLVGMALATGIAETGREVIVFDEGDLGLNASRGNAGLIWVQGKGERAPAYAAWTRRSAELWPAFAGMLSQRTGIDVEYQQPGGFHLCVSEKELAMRTEMVRAVGGGSGANGIVMVDREFVRERVPLIGSRVLGASWSPLDGDVNPLALLRALYCLGQTQGVDYRAGQTVRSIERSSSGAFRIDTGDISIDASNVVLAAGLGNRSLGAMVGLDVPVAPVRGQIVVTERLPRFLNHPTTTIRQNATGTVMFGNSNEPDSGFDRSTSLGITGGHARRAIVEFPHLANAQVVRSWAALRVMPSDELPIYDQSKSCPGAFVVTCHSGVTLAAVHARHLAGAIAAGGIPQECAGFSSERFHAAPARTH
jgi:glycine/D-amino acid oxidase-like deaminating enzyme